MDPRKPTCRTTLSNCERAAHRPLLGATPSKSSKTENLSRGERSLNHEGEFGGDDSPCRELLTTTQLAGSDFRNSPKQTKEGSTKTSNERKARTKERPGCLRHRGAVPCHSTPKKNAASTARFCASRRQGCAPERRACRAFLKNNLSGDHTR